MPSITLITFKPLDVSIFTQQNLQRLEEAKTVVREINKYWSRMIRPAEINNDLEMIGKLLIDAFHMVRVSALLMHPIAPAGTEMIRDYLRLDERFWDWAYAFEPVYAFMPDPANHPVRFLEPRVDFFPKHPAQLASE